MLRVCFVCPIVSATPYVKKELIFEFKHCISRGKYFHNIEPFSMKYQLTSWHRNYLHLVESQRFVADCTTDSHCAVLRAKWKQRTSNIRRLLSMTSFFRWCFLPDFPLKILHTLLLCFSYLYCVPANLNLLEFITELRRKYSNNSLYERNDKISVLLCIET